MLQAVGTGQDVSVTVDTETTTVVRGRAVTVAATEVWAVTVGVTVTSLVKVIDGDDTQIQLQACEISDITKLDKTGGI